jgi:benzoyl-CoA reductase/2-hydroxyglutaryl-CoA dehydratase subunit BcrC/BadD/HgdB
MILQDMTNDKVLTAIHDVFFREDTGGNQHNINDRLIAGLFAPFYQSMLTQYHVDTFFQELIKNDSDKTIDGYISYLMRLSQTYHNDIALSQQKITQLVINILQHFGIVSTDMEPEHKTQTLTRILQDLFGIQNHVDIAKLDF